MREAERGAAREDDRNNGTRTGFRPVLGVKHRRQPEEDKRGKQQHSPAAGAVDPANGLHPYRTTAGRAEGSPGGKPEGINAVVESIVGVLPWFVKPDTMDRWIQVVTRAELAEDPGGLIANLLLRAGERYAADAHQFGAVYLVWLIVIEYRKLKRVRSEKPGMQARGGT